MDNRPAVVLIGLDNITGLQSARILAGRGVRVVGLAANRRHFACRTRACERIVETAISGPGLLATLRAQAAEFEQPPVLIPCTDQAVLDVAAHGPELEESYRFVLPDFEVAAMLVDKARFSTFAQAHNLPIPPTRVLTDRESVIEAGQVLSFPAIVKPGLKSATWKTRTTAKGFVVSDAAELLDRYDEAVGWADDLIAQELVEGDATRHFTCNLYFDRRGEPLASLVTRKLRQWPPGTGTGSLGVECKNDSVLAESLNLFESVPYRGLAYVELKQNERTGTYLIIEPNIGRPTGRSATSEAAGQEFLYAAYADAAGLPLDFEVAITRPGTKWMYLRQDVQSAGVGIRRGELTVRDWLHSLRGPKTFAIFSLRDPLPFIWDVFQATGKAIRQWLARRGRQDRG